MNCSMLGERFLVVSKAPVDFVFFVFSVVETCGKMPVILPSIGSHLSF